MACAGPLVPSQAAWLLFWGGGCIACFFFLECIACLVRMGYTRDYVVLVANFLSTRSCCASQSLGHVPLTGTCHNMFSRLLRCILNCILHLGGGEAAGPTEQCPLTAGDMDCCQQGCSTHHARICMHASIIAHPTVALSCLACACRYDQVRQATNTRVASEGAGSGSAKG